MVEDEWRWELREKSDEEHELDDLRAELDRLRAELDAVKARAREVIDGTGPVDLDLDSAEDTARYIIGEIQ